MQGRTTDLAALRRDLERQRMIIEQIRASSREITGRADQVCGCLPCLFHLSSRTPARRHTRSSPDKELPRLSHCLSDHRSKKSVLAQSECRTKILQPSTTLHTLHQPHGPSLVIEQVQTQYIITSARDQVCRLLTSSFVRNSYTPFSHCSIITAHSMDAAPAQPRPDPVPNRLDANTRADPALG